MMEEANGKLPKVLIVDLSVGYGGSTSRVLSLLQRSLPGRIGLACLEGTSVTDHAREMGLPVHIMGRNKMDPGILYNLVRLVRREKYEILDSQNIQSKFWANFAAILTRTTLVSTLHSWYIDEHGKDTLKGKIYSGLEVFTNRGLDLYITVSQKDRQALLAARVPEEDIALIYNAVDIEPGSIEARPDWLRQRFGLAAGAIVCTAVGRLVIAKNYAALISAMPQALQEVPELVCLIIGEGDYRERLEEQIRVLGLAKHVKLVGYMERNDVLSIVKSSDIYAMPSRYEGTPIALLEAAALGQPILATKAGGIPELVTDEEHAVLVESTDVEGMAGALVKLCRDREFAAALAGRAREHTRQAFSVEKQLESTWEAYKRALERHADHQYLYWG